MPETTNNELASWLISSKWMPPRHHVSTINRPSLIHSLNQGFKQKLCLVTAPAGFGKTTLLSQWREQLLHEDARVAWLTLDEADGDLNNLLSYMVFSLLSSGLELGRLPMLAEQGLSDTSPRSCLGILLNHIREDAGSTVLILDDYHRLDSPKADQLFDELLANAPDNFHLIINSREKPDFDIGRLRSQGQLLELGPELLRFNAEELKEVMGPGLDEAQLSSLLDKSEGWPVTIQLLRQLIESGGERQQLLTDYSGRTAHLAEYLSEQILNKCEPDVRDFLLKTSILERVSNSLGKAVSGVDDGFERLERTSSIATLFVPLDGNRGWLRYHHLFADYLKAQLQLRYPEQVQSLHLEASRWFKQDNNLIEAVRHACLAENYDEAAGLIEQAGGWELILYGGIGFLRRLLQYIPEQELRNHPRLQVARAYLCQKEGGIIAARSYLEQAAANSKLSELTFLEKRQAFDRDLSIVGVLQSNYEDELGNSAKYLQSADRAQHKDDSIFNGVLYCSLSLYMMAEARFDQGIDYVQQAVRFMRQADSVLGTNYCYLHLGVLSFYKGNVRQAEAYFREAQAMADENFGSDSGLKYLADILLFTLQDWRGEASEDLAGFDNALKHVEDFDGWYEIYIAAYELLWVRALQDRKARNIEMLRDRCQRMVDARLNKRLELFTASCDLALAMLSGDELQAERILHQYQEALQSGGSRYWRPLQHLGVAAITWYMDQKDFSAAERCLEQMEAQCRESGALCFLVNALVLKAELAFHRKKPQQAAVLLFEAAALAWPENIMRPFIRSNESIALIAMASNLSRDQVVDRLSLNFLQQCSLQAKKLKKHNLSQQELLSSREMEVLLQLKGGLSNKEIARALEMTEHTVKFHLKNVFSKLGVDKRTKAVLAAQEQGVLD